MARLAGVLSPPHKRRSWAALKRRKRIWEMASAASQGSGCRAEIGMEVVQILSGLEVLGSEGLNWVSDLSAHKGFNTFWKHTALWQ